MKHLRTLALLSLVACQRSDTVIHPEGAPIPLMIASPEVMDAMGGVCSHGFQGITNPKTGEVWHLEVTTTGQGPHTETEIRRFRCGEGE